MLILKDIHFKYDDQKLLQNVSLTLKKGKIGSLIGFSGSGKTTLFKLLTGLLTPLTGTISVDNKTGNEFKHQIACMMQEDLLLPWRTILDNLLLLNEIDPKKKNRLEAIDEARSILNEMKLSSYEKKFPHELSVGMRQRVSLARALLQKRPLLLLDEPFAALDVALREQMYLILREVQEKQNTTILMITHDFRDALSLSDHIFFLSDGKIAHEWVIEDSTRNDPAKSGIFLNYLREIFLKFN